MTSRAVVAIGGGHGLAMTLRAVVPWASPITAVVSVGDDGGSSGRLRAELGIAPPGDVRRCLSSLASDAAVAELFEQRFQQGDLTGHPVGNIVIAGLLQQGIGVGEAVDRLRSWTGLRADIAVLPSASVPVTLHASTAAGPVAGQVAIQHTVGIDQLWIEPAEPPVDDGVVSAIAAADLIVVGPGSLFTSTLAALAVPAVVQAIESAPAPLVYVCNVRSVEAESRGFDLAQHIGALRRHGIVPDVVVAQEGALPPGDLGAYTGTVRVVDVDRPHGLAHDPELLGPVLESLASGA